VAVWFNTFLLLLIFSFALWLVDHAGDGDSHRIVAERLPGTFGAMQRRSIQGYLTVGALRRDYLEYLSNSCALLDFLT
jgi:hypothetical protein